MIGMVSLRMTHSGLLPYNFCPPGLCPEPPLRQRPAAGRGSLPRHPSVADDAMMTGDENQGVRFDETLASYRRSRPYPLRGT